MDAPQKRQLLDAHSPGLFALTSFSLAKALMVRPLAAVAWSFACAAGA